MVEAVDTDNMGGQNLLVVFVHGCARIVKINWQKILGEICDKLGLQIRKYAVEADDLGMFQGWVEINMPMLLHGTSETKVFTGDVIELSDEALESAAEAAVDFFVKHCGVVIKDANYEKMKAAEKRALKAEFFSSAYYDMLTARQRREALARARFGNLVNGLKDLCKRYKDQLPIGVMGVGNGLNNGVVEKLVYTGSVASGKEIDEFALGLVTAVNQMIDYTLAQPAQG